MACSANFFLRRICGRDRRGTGQGLGPWRGPWWAQHGSACVVPAALVRQRQSPWLAVKAGKGSSSGDCQPCGLRRGGGGDGGGRGGGGGGRPMERRPPRRRWGEQPARDRAQCCLWVWCHLKHCHITHVMSGSFSQKCTVASSVMAPGQSMPITSKNSSSMRTKYSAWLLSASKRCAPTYTDSVVSVVAAV